MEHFGESGEISNVESEQGSNNQKDRPRKLSDLTSVVTEIMSRLREDPETMEAEVERILGGFIDRKFTLEKQRGPCTKNRDSLSEVYPNTTRHLRLQFRDKLPLSVVTGEYIKGEEGNSIGVALVDSLTGQVVVSGPLASAKVEILVLEKDSDGGSNWTSVEFDNANVGRREGNTTLLGGNVYCTLANGVGVLDLVKFKHTKQWMKKHEYRLGVRILDDFPGVEVEEAMTEPFVVEDKRGKLYQKSYPPSLSDEVWRLEGIGKEGAYHKRLREENFHTVKDLLILLNTNPQRLAQILRVSISSKIWEVIVHHARTCLPDEEAYLFYPPNSRQWIAVVFDVVGQLKGLLLENQFVPSDELSKSQKADAHKSVVSAFQQWGDVVPVDDVASLFAGYQQPQNSVHVIDYNLSDHQDISDFEASNTLCPDEYTQLDTTRNPDGTISHGDASISGNFDQLGTGNLHCISSHNFCLEAPSVFSGVEEAGLVTLDASYVPSSFFGHNEEENDLGNLYGSHSPFQDDIAWGLENSGASYHNIVQSPGLSWDANLLSNDNFQNNDINSLTYDQLMNPGGPVSTSSTCETEFMDDGFFMDELLQDNAVLELQKDHGASSASVAVAKARKRNFNRKNAQRRWKILFSIMRWFSVRRDVTGRTSAYKDRFALSRAHIFSDHKSKNTILGSQTSLHSTVNDLFLTGSTAVAMNKVQRRYISKREKAQARWRMLFSVMRWFSVKRNVDIKIRVRDMLKNLSVVPSHYSTGDTGAPFSAQPGMSEMELSKDSNSVDNALLNSSAVRLNKSSRRYLARRNKAQRRWRMLFSVVRWFSVRRNVNEKGRLMLMGCT